MTVVDTRRPARKGCLFVVLLVLACGVGLLTAIVAVPYTLHERVAGWPKTRGRMTNIAFGATDSTGHGLKLADGSYLTATYTYNVDGKEYQSDRIAPPFLIQDTGMMSRESVQLKYDLGGEFSVHYNPTQPEEGYILFNRNLILAFRVSVIAGGVLTLLLATGAFFARPRKSKGDGTADSLDRNA